MDILSINSFKLIISTFLKWKLKDGKLPNIHLIVTILCRCCLKGSVNCDNVPNKGYITSFLLKTPIQRVIMQYKTIAIKHFRCVRTKDL